MSHKLTQNDPNDKSACETKVTTTFHLKR